jgi:hypothetical protein
MSSLERNENGVLRRMQPRGRGHSADVLNLVVRLHFPFVDAGAASRVRRAANAGHAATIDCTWVSRAADRAGDPVARARDRHLTRAADVRACRAATVLPVMAAHAHDLQAIEGGPGTPLSPEEFQNARENYYPGGCITSVGLQAQARSRVRAFKRVAASSAS